MKSATLTLQEAHLAALRQYLLRSDSCERAAYILFGTASISRDPWTSEPNKRFLSREVIPVPESSIIHSSPYQVTWNTNSYVDVLKRSRLDSLAVGIAHNHSDAFPNFSDQDSRNEPDLVQLAKNRNGPETGLVSIIVTPSHVIGRTWLDTRQNCAFDLIRIFGERFSLQYENRGDDLGNEAFHRQSLAFGKALTQDLLKLRIGVVGCGGTGSATAMLLARLGVQKLLLIDKDVVETTNLNRLHGARMVDALQKRPKVEVVKNAIEEIGLGTHVVGIQSWVNDENCRDALRSCDIVFGCSDDNQGRLFLNRFAYYYLIPVIDMGLAIDVTKTEPPQIQSLDGRVTVLYPGNACLLCRGVINTKMAMSEALRRSDPNEYERQKMEAYVLGEGEPNPAVVTFTTEVATMAANELLHRLQGFRGENGSTPQRTRLFHRMHDLRPGEHPSPECSVCGDGSSFGRGDVEPFLGRVD